MIISNMKFYYILPLNQIHNFINCSGIVHIIMCTIALIRSFWWEYGNRNLQRNHIFCLISKRFHQIIYSRCCSMEHMLVFMISENIVICEQRALYNLLTKEFRNNITCTIRYFMITIPGEGLLQYIFNIISKTPYRNDLHF